MKVAVIGAGGNAGRRVVFEAALRGHQITAIGPTLEKLPTGERIVPVVSNLLDTAAMVELVSPHEVIVSAVRFVRYKPDDLLNVARKSAVPRLVIVGGAGSLLTADGVQLADSPAFPEVARAEAESGRQLLQVLRGVTDVDWTFISPAAVFAPGERLGHYRTGVDELIIGRDGVSKISMEDYAIALMDEVENPRHSRARFSVGY